MRETGLFDRLGSGGVILCLGAHSDDIEIGCGGAIRKLADASNDLTVHWIVLSASGVRDREARSSAEAMLSSAKNSKIEIRDFRNGFFPYQATDIKEYFETLKTLQNPDLIFTHCGHDRHQDHRLVSELTWNTFRDHLILEYEIPKYDGDLRSPNVFVTLSQAQVQTKQEHLMSHFKSQQDKQWFTEDTFSSLCRLRGIECNSPTGFAEGFHSRKIIL
jgi:LmbE family N-acetylglucosaminyl deacetylase